MVVVGGWRYNFSVFLKNDINEIQYILEQDLLLPLLPDAFGLAEGVFSSFFTYVFNTIVKTDSKGGEIMDEDNDIFEMFLELMEQLQSEDPDGRMRLLSKDPRYAADDPAKSKHEQTKR